MRKNFIYIYIYAPNLQSGFDTSLHILDSGDEELINILQSSEMEKTPKKAAKVITERLEGYFCSTSVFNLSKKSFDRS